MQEEGTQYRQRPAATRSAAARMLSTVPAVDGGGEAGRAAHLDGELVEFRRPRLLGEQEGLFGEVGDGDGVEVGEGVAGGDQDAEGVAAEQQRGDLRRGERGAADADVEAAVGELLVLLGDAGLDLVDDQAGVAGLDLVQDLGHGVVAGVDDGDAERGGGARGAAGGVGGALHVGEDLPGLDQEHGAGGGQRDVVGAALEEADAELALEPLDLLAQRGLDDVLPLGRPAEVQLLRQRHEIAKLP